MKQVQLFSVGSSLIFLVYFIENKLVVSSFTNFIINFIYIYCVCVCVCIVLVNKCLVYGSLYLLS